MKFEYEGIIKKKKNSSLGFLLRLLYIVAGFLFQVVLHILSYPVIQVEVEIIQIEDCTEKAREILNTSVLLV